LIHLSFSLSAASSHPCSSFIYWNRPRVKPVLRLGDGERIKYLIARVLATVSEQNGSYGSRFIIFFSRYSLLLFSLRNKYLTSIMPAWNLPFFYNIWFFKCTIFFKYLLFYHWFIQIKMRRIKIYSSILFNLYKFTYKCVMRMFVERDANNT